MTEHRDVRSARCVLGGREGAAERGTHPEHREVVRRDGLGVHHLRHVAELQGDAPVWAVARHVLERAHIAEGEKLRRRDEVVAAVDRGVNRDDPIDVGERQSTEDDRVEDAEHRRRRTNA